MATKPAPVTFGYSSEPTRNPFRYLLALWRLVRDPSDTEEAAIVELGFARTRLGRRFARWEEVVEALRRDPRTAPALQRRRPCDPIDLDALGRMPEGTLGRVFAEHCKVRALNPNLVYIAPDTEVDWMLHHLYLTHDIWHVVSGWGNDEIGEYGPSRRESEPVPAVNEHGSHRIIAAAQQLVLQRFAPACALVNLKLEVLYLHGPIDDYLQLPRGQQTHDLIAMTARGPAHQTSRVRPPSDPGKQAGATGRRAGASRPAILSRSRLDRTATPAG